MCTCFLLPSTCAGVILLGDAAHAVTPVFGQGANSALESCRILDDVLSAGVDPATNKVRAGAGRQWGLNKLHASCVHRLHGVQ